MKPAPDFSFEDQARAGGYAVVAGVDEAGRGPLAGPVTAAAVILDRASVPEGLTDSKALSRKQREALFEEIDGSGVWALGTASVAEIDDLNILRASHLAMERAVSALPRLPDLCLIDGHLLPASLPCLAQAIVKGDARSQSIAAASIMAKVCRDRVMYDLAQHHPGYGWETNVGYPSKSHISALRDLGVTPHHRRSFKPVRNILWQEK
ncbi:MAG: ribonuclease HII [Pseudomonadota bacterium]